MSTPLNREQVTNKDLPRRRGRLLGALRWPMWEKTVAEWAHVNG